MQTEPRFVAVLDKVKAKIRVERLSVADPGQLAANTRAKEDRRPAVLR